MEDRTPTATPILLDEEARLAAEKRALISRVTLEIEGVLLRENLTMGDWLEIADMINARSSQYFANFTIKSIRDNYGKV